MPGPTPFTNDDVEQILRVVDRLNDIEIRLESGDLKLHVRKFSSRAESAAIQPPIPVPVAQELALDAPAGKSATGARRAVEAPPGTVAIRAAMVGIFYRAPSPSDPPFVEINRRVSANDTLCVLEVMKLFNTITAGVAGTVIEILAENGAMVEYGQALFFIRPD